MVCINMIKSAAAQCHSVTAMALSTLHLTVLCFALLLCLIGGAQTEVPPSCLASAGVPGNPGHNGLPGRDGRDGKDGREGVSGSKGDRGDPGVPVPGLPGKMGPAGPKGSKGENGVMEIPESADVLMKSLKTDIQTMGSRLSTVEKAMGFRIIRRVGMKYYVTEGLQDDFDAGLRFCRDAGGDLVLPKNEEENNVLVKMLQVLEAPIGWIRTTDRKTEGIFLDTDNSTLSFTKWKPGEPNDHNNNEDCSMVYTATGLWNDILCDRKYHIVCEIS
ncbi:hypothetical protein AALO_G00256140 [Alosa alosa]|uniref:C-type lectin domain-containing protein n=1 Tax=Alosa alosa TaxID=278164 RepID=A0AAV6FPH2_9TELE|nr:mannose-binding protein A-like [Alosa alosa]KAG5264615.1 hypothetical protein AALO_G00256140 [Alosa alosa]